MRVDTAQRTTQWCRSGVGNHRRTAAATSLPKDQKDKTVLLIVSITRCCELHDQGARAPTASQRSRSAQCRVVVLEVQARHPGRCNLPQSVSGEDQRRSHSQGASGENPMQNNSRRASGEKKIKKQHGYKDSEKNIEATIRSQSSAQRREGVKW